MDAGPAPQGARRRNKHRAGKKKKKSARRKSFAATQEEDMAHDEMAAPGDGFYLHRGLSNTSLDSEALLDHREQQSVRPRRPSIAITAGSGSSPSHHGQQLQTPSSSRLRTIRASDSADEDDEESTNEGAPLLSQSARLAAAEAALSGYGSRDAGLKSVPHSRNSSAISGDRRKFLNPFAQNDGYNVNYPPSVPGSPLIRPSDGLGAINFTDDLLRDEINRSDALLGREIGVDQGHGQSPPVMMPSPLDRRHTVCLQAEEDVCFPQEGMSEMADDEPHIADGTPGPRRGRRRRGKWPDLAVLEEWSHLEKEDRSEERRVKKITEPQLINGRLRPVNKTWFRAEDDAPYRFTYFNEDFQSTIHSQTISELVQPGGSFRELFMPEPTLLEDSSDEDEEDEFTAGAVRQQPIFGDSRAPSRQASVAHTGSQTCADPRDPRDPRDLGVNVVRTLSPTTGRESREGTNSTGLGLLSGQATPIAGRKSPAESATHQNKTPTPPEPRLPKPPRFGERPVWWLDVFSPTEAEMRVISKAFGIHPLTAEDIIMQEAREKVELFRHYYFVNYRTFDQDQDSENFLEPVNMYVVVFREGVLSFHFSITPHPANVRRRVRQLRDYMILSADWISYAIIDDITDVFVPLIQKIENEVDEIDDAVLELHSPLEEEGEAAAKSKKGHSAKDSARDSAMLRRIGDCRKKVMGLYRLLGNKADVIKGFAKRCNEHWEVAPRSDIGLYLGDIQDHIVTMTSNLGHYEKILARSHANYLAQINLRMNERQEETADILGKLTILGTIVLPMNLVTGLWGMNVWVPGQEMEQDLRWFFCITTLLISGGLLCFWLVKRLYNL